MLIRRLITHKVPGHVRHLVRRYPLDNLLENSVNPETVPREQQKSVKVAFIGEPNAGKSSLINRYLDQNISIVTAKAQTTNRNVIGVITDGDVQVILIDTPGMPYFPGMSVQRLESDEIAYVRPIQTAVKLADILVYVIDPTEPVYTCFLRARFKEIFDDLDVPKFLVLNKLDIIKEKSRLIAVQKQMTRPMPNRTIVPIKERTDITSPLDLKLKYSDGVPFDDVFAVSAHHGTNLEHLRQVIQDHAVLRPWEYPPDEVCPDSLEDVVCDLFREMLLKMEGSLSFVVKQSIVSVEEKDGIVYITHQSISPVKLFQGREDFNSFRSHMTDALEERFGIDVVLNLHCGRVDKFRSLDDDEEDLF